mgnify:CR=1 FL=1
MLGEGTGFEDLTYTIGLNDEEYGVGFRKGSDLAPMLNDFFKKVYADGTMEDLANLIGETRINVSKLLNDLQKKELIMLKRKEIFIPSLEMLTEELGY